MEMLSVQRAKLFTKGRLQAVQLPQSCHFDGTEVAIKRFNGGVFLLPIQSPYDIMQSAVNEFEDGFIMEREPQGTQERESLL